MCAILKHAQLIEFQAAIAHLREATGHSHWTDSATMSTVAICNPIDSLSDEQDTQAVKCIRRMQRDEYRCRILLTQDRFILKGSSSGTFLTDS